MIAQSSSSPQASSRSDARLVDGCIVLDHKILEHPRKITGTRLPQIMGANGWKTPAQAWCNMVGLDGAKTENTKYALAGKIIEPLVIEHLRTNYFMSDIVTGDQYGGDSYDFFGDHYALGGRFDAIRTDGNGNATAVIEIKTTGDTSKWTAPDGRFAPPLDYMLQASLYAYLLNVDRVIIACVVLRPDQYPIPAGDSYDCTPTQNITLTQDNTILYQYSLKIDFPQFASYYIPKAKEWWDKHIKTLTSPPLDAIRDAYLMSRIATTEADGESFAEALAIADEARHNVDTVKAKIKGEEKRANEAEKRLKEELRSSMPPDAIAVTARGEHYTYALKRGEREEVDIERLRRDYPDIVNNYLIISEKLTLTKTLNE